MPARYGFWQAVHGLFQRWQQGRSVQHIITGLQAQTAAAGLIGWDISIDATTVRGHQHAPGARRDFDHQADPLNAEPADHAFG
ncbi:hypothetical protein HDA40_001839 [Hamadaea flava]|uniref:Transposase n=1 Tax=Hamadaea flava TaxID=1742688 RepID=A0ABV8LPA4_9ACTN|nr:hypothetical protein [Hamadaea flava]MCP2323332.1 hypothetical protein [Hamadaea flava]